MHAWTRRLLGLFALVMAATAATAEPSRGEGVWLARASDTTIFRIAVVRTGRGWTATWVRPLHFSFDGYAFSRIAGPAVRRVAREVHATAEGLELTFDDPEPNSRPDRLTIHATGPDTATLAWQLVVAGLPLVRDAHPAAPLPSWPPRKRYAVDFDRPTNAEMTAMFEADQADRQTSAIDWSVVGPRDEARRERTKALLDGGALQSGDDFWHAAFVFQHGGTSGDYLLAHTLAVIAAARGRPDATWIAAATLDRYLQHVGQKQVYGTQFSLPPGGATTQEPYDRTLVSDQLRQALGVPPLVEQEARRREIDAVHKAPPPK